MAGFDSPDDAAQAALKEAMRRSKRFEHAGAIYEQDGRFFFTDPEESGSRNEVGVSVRYPEGARLAALYHTHPRDSRRSRGTPSDTFSAADVQIADKLGLPYYLGAVEGSEMRVFKPGQSKTRTQRDGSRISPGDPFLAQIPMDRIRAMKRQRPKLAQLDSPMGQGVLRDIERRKRE